MIITSLIISSFSFEDRVQAYWGYCEQERGTYLETQQVERGAGTSGKTEKIQVTNKHRRVKEETDSDDSEFWMLKSSSGSESEQESDEENCKGSHCDAKEYEELSQRTKRMSIEIGPSSFASRKKKIRNDNESCFRRSLFFIAKESKNLQFAWDLSAQISNSPLLLSTAAASRRPLTVLDSEPNIRDMAVLLYQAQKLHYDSATMIMRLKATIQSLEGQMSSVTEKSAKYAWIAAEEVHKSLYCLGVRLTTEWFQNFELQGSSRREAMLWLLSSSITVFTISLQDSDTQSYHFFGHNDDGRTPIKFRNPKYLSILNYTFL
ncbi:hypothetical protein Bca4012_028081 [Brassica carinata]|uniref:Uncharacterized protein n=1 Tax=Brassica carinata TaxID=52824 RepID=A0A8X7VKU4_BRACI|nr:hypothetical protein Bca52824_025090 [Brassica carinata]